MTDRIRIRVRVRLFAIQREIAGTRDALVELDAPAAVDDAWAALVGQFPLLAPGRSSVRFAVNGVYADPVTPLADGDEVAMIPPVSGGSADDRAPVRRVLRLQAEPFESGILDGLARTLATPEDGAVVGFLGITRRSPGTPAPGQEAEAARHAGRAVQALEYEALEPMALRILEDIANEIVERFGVERLAIVHRTGVVPLGEASTAIVACSPHRGAAFEAAAYAIDETKARAPIWKAERFEDGHVWIGEPPRDGPRDGPRASGPGPERNPG
ncbi:MAG: molybdenum cofactor biosynthesis protein MoaE [Candidatus Limnocylindrales bacterium]